MARRDADAAECARVVRALAEWKSSRQNRHVVLLSGGMGCAVTSLVRVRHFVCAMTLWTFATIVWMRWVAFSVARHCRAVSA